MQIIKNGLYCLLILMLVSCATIGKPDNTFKSTLNEPKDYLRDQLGFNGIYEINESEKYYLESPIYFFRNGLVYQEIGSIPDSSKYQTWLRKYVLEQKTWGTYEIRHDTINVHIFEPYYDGAAHYLQTNYRGIIKNKYTIMGWHTVHHIHHYPKAYQKLITFQNIG